MSDGNSHLLHIYLAGMLMQEPAAAQAHAAAAHHVCAYAMYCWFVSSTLWSADDEETELIAAEVVLHDTI